MNFFFGSGQDDASIPYQSFEGAAVDPQVIDGQHSLAGRVQQARPAAGSDWIKGGRGIPPPFFKDMQPHMSLSLHMQQKLPQL
jgi:hypothetical protein